MLKTAVGRFRMIGLLEGASFLLLLAIAMPLKYYADMPLAVTIMGSLHGLLFVLYLLALALVVMIHRWPLHKIILALLASVIPIGTFVMDRWLRLESK